MFALNGQKQPIGDVAPSTVLYDFLRSSTPYTVRRSRSPDLKCRWCYGLLRKLVQLSASSNLSRMQNLVAAWCSLYRVSRFAKRFTLILWAVCKTGYQPVCRAPKMAAAKVDVAHVPFKFMRWIANQVRVLLAGLQTVGIASY